MTATYITTTIPYVNARPHIGHALELVQADVLARYRRGRGEAVRFQSGTDDNSLKNVLAAQAAGTGVREFVDRNADAFAALGSALSLSFDDFIRTSRDPRHRPGVERFWRACSADLYRRRYEGLYCTGCEQFYPPAELRGGRCPEHETVPQRVSEENWFFRLSRYAEPLRAAVTSGRLRIEPAGRRNEVLAFIDAGLEDFSVSRPAGRAGGWGINQARPWELARAGGGQDQDERGRRDAQVRLDAVLGQLLGACSVLGRELEPFLPDLAGRVRAQCAPGDDGRLPVPRPVFRRLSAPARSAPPAGLGVEEPEQDQQDDGADDRSDDPDRVEAVDAQVVVLDQVLQEAAHERAHDAEHDGAEDPDGVAAGDQQPGDGAGDEADDDEHDDESDHAGKLPRPRVLCALSRIVMKTGSSRPARVPAGCGTAG
jgi:hypothetical protein